MASFNPYTDFNVNPGTFSSGSFGSGSLGSYSPPDFYQFKPSSNLFKTPPGDFSSFYQPGSGSSDSADKKKSLFENIARFAGQGLEAYSKARQSQAGQSQAESSGLTVGGGGGGVSQNGDLTIVYPQPKQVIPAQGGGLGGTIGSVLGAGLGTLIAPGIGTTLGSQIGGAAGSFFG